jgi:hypothetical protein
MNVAMRRLIRTRAGGRCEYCGIHDDDEPYAFHVEHVVPKKHGEDDHSSSLAWSCQSCNLGKSSNLSGRLKGEVAALFHPRRERWERHFHWDGPRLVGKTKCGQVTIRVLNINGDDRIALRQALIVLREFPPKA